MLHLDIYVFCGDIYWQHKELERKLYCGECHKQNNDRNTRIIHQILGKQVRKTVNLTGVFCYGRVFRIGLRVDCRLSMSRWMSVGRRRCIFMSPTAALWVCCHSEHCSCLGHRSGQRQRIVSNDIHFLKHLPIGWNHQGSLSPVTEPDPYLLLWRSIFFGSPR